MGDFEHKKSILVLTSTFPRWIDDTDPPFVMELCKRLVKEDIAVDVLAPHAYGTKSKEVMNGVNVYRYKYFLSKWELLAYEGGILANLKKNKWLYILVPVFLVAQTLSILSLIKKNRYDLIHAHWIIPQGLISVFISRYIYKASPKILCTSHGGDLFAFQSSIFNKIKKWVLDYSDGITVVSEHMRKICLKFINNKEKIHVCSMGVDLVDTFIPLEYIGRDSNKIIFVGRLVEKKGVNVLLKATHRLIQNYPELKLVIVGDGPERSKLEAQCNDLNIEHNVEFIGAVTQNRLPELFSSASIAVMPSIIDSRNDQEGLGLVAIEAMGCGCAVIASSLPAVVDIIESGVNGVLVKPGDSVELSNVIEDLQENPETKSSIASRARQSVIKKFDWQTVATSYSDLIKSICAKE
jgi:glycosyltransferase involved in cell wall biosynthesis